MSSGIITLQLLKKIHDQAVELSKQLTFNKKHSLHLQAISLYGSILELSSNIAMLTRDGPKTGIPIILKSLFEAVVDLINLCDDPKYGYFLEAREANDWLNFLGEALRGGNPYLDQVSEIPDLRETHKKHKKALADLKSQGYHPIQIQEKFERAGLLPEYVTIYAELCTHSHNTIRALRSRHVEITENDFNVVFYKLISLDEIEPYIGVSCELLVRATEKIHKLLNSKVLKGVSELRTEVDEHKTRLAN